MCPDGSSCIDGICLLKCNQDSQCDSSNSCQKGVCQPRIAEAKNAARNDRPAQWKRRDASSRHSNGSDQEKWVWIGIGAVVSLFVILLIFLIIWLVRRRSSRKSTIMITPAVQQSIPILPAYVGAKSEKELPSEAPPPYKPS